MVQSTENVLASDPARGWQFVGGRNPGIEFINVVNAAVLDATKESP